MRNGIGKTSLFHAIKWGFYGEVGMHFYKDSEEIFVHQFMNDRVDEKTEKLFVEIWFKYGNDRYSLKRIYDPSDDKSESSVTLTKNEREEITGEAAQEKIELIIPKNFANFFMFDGEQLSRFMASQRELYYQDSVEQLLGLKQLRVLRDDIKDIQRGYEKELSQLKTTDSRVNAKNKLIEGFSREIQNNDIKIEGLTKEITENEKHIDKFENHRKRYSKQLGIQEKLNSLKDKREARSNKLTTLKSALVSNRSFLFARFIKSDLEKLRKENNKQTKKLEDVCGLTNKQANAQEGKEEILKKSVPECDVCGHKLTKEEANTVKEELKKIKRNLELFKKNKSERDSLTDENNVFQEYLDKIAEFDFDEVTDDLAEAKQKYEDTVKEINNAEKETQHTEISNYNELSSKIDGLREENIRKSGKIKILKHKNEEIEELKNNELKELKRLGHDNKLIGITGRKSEFVIDLINNLDKALELGKEKKRKQILKEANRLFLKITNKPKEYESIDFEDDKSYSFVIKTKDKKVVNSPSKGEKQVLAMSFLLGLSQYTGRRNVIVMDTPVTSLDDIHALGIGKSFADLKNQVIFLAQPQELQGDIYKNMKKSIVKEYKGERKGYRTVIV